MCTLVKNHFSLNSDGWEVEAMKINRFFFFGELLKGRRKNWSARVLRDQEDGNV